MKNITENIVTNNTEVTFYNFISHVKSFLRGLLTSPITIDVDDFFKSHDINKKQLLSLLIERGIIEKETKITNEDGKDNFTIKYKIPKRNFERKIRRLYSFLFEKHEIKESILNEDGEGGGGATSCGSAMQGGGSNPDAGQFIVPLGKVQRRKIAHVTQEQAEFLKEYYQKNNKIKGIRYKK